MVRKAHGAIGFVIPIVGGALVLSAAALAQNVTPDQPATKSNGQTQAAPAEPRLQQSGTFDDPQCGGGLGRFLNQLVSPPNPFGSACDLREEW